MEKVKITQEQADAVEDVLEWKSIDDVINLHVDRSRPWRDEWSALNDFKISKLARALYCGYEVEPEFNVGDWVIEDDYNAIGQITRIVGDEINAYYSNEPDRETHIYAKYLKHATPQEIATEKTRRWWKKHDREVWQLKRHDVLKDDRGNSFEVDGFLGSGEEQKVLFKPGHRDFMSNVKDSCGIVCFVEDRKDI